MWCQVYIMFFPYTYFVFRFLHDKRIQKLYVQYKFLDLPQEELETPFALPKPKFEEKIQFNFRY